MVLPGLPHHVLQRGNRRQTIFFDDDDRRAYVQMLSQACLKHDTRCLAWCLMDNHAHLILVPRGEDGLRAPLASAHTAYSQRINRKLGTGGHLFQGRFASYPMDDAHLLVAARYIENNPVSAGLVARAEDWPWSSARAHVDGSIDGLTDVAALAAHIPDWRAMLKRGLEAADEAERIELALRCGKPAGAETWLRGLEEFHGLPLVPRGKGRPPKKGTVPISTGEAIPKKGTVPISASPARDTRRPWP